MALLLLLYNYQVLRRSQVQSVSEEISMNNEFNIVNLLMIDHHFLKECISIIVDKKADKSTKFASAKEFLETLKKHWEAEEKTVYDSLADIEVLRSLILGGEFGYESIKNDILALLPKFSELAFLDDQAELEVKVLASFVEYHLKKEEKFLFPKIRKHLDCSILNEIGFQFMIMRKFNIKELKSNLALQKEIYQIQNKKMNNKKYDAYTVSADFIKKVNRYINSLITDSQYI